MSLKGGGGAGKEPKLFCGTLSINEFSFSLRNNLPVFQLKKTIGEGKFRRQFFFSQSTNKSI